MKIVFLQDDFPPLSFGGAGISTYELARGMQKCGHEVFVITTCRKGSDAGVVEYHGIKIHKIASDYNPRWRAYVSVYNVPVVRQVEQLLKEIKPDVVHISNVHYYLSYRTLAVAKKYAKVVVFTARDTMTICYGKLGTKRYLESFDSRTTWRDHLGQAKKRWNPLLNFFIKRYLACADALFAISKSLQEAMKRNGIQNVEVIYNGIDLNEWNVTVDAVQEFKTKHALGDKKILFFGGRLSEAKGGLKALEALTHIVKVIPNAVLLIAGSVDTYAQAMKAYAQKFGIGENLVFTGWIEREEIKVAYATADVVLMPSIYLDPFGRINIEAMASKKPVVGTCYGGTPEIIVDGVTGYIVNPLYPNEIAEKSIDLLKNPEKAKQFGEAGYTRARQNFNLEDKVKEYILCYTKLLQKKLR